MVMLVLKLVANRPHINNTFTRFYLVQATMLGGYRLLQQMNFVLLGKNGLSAVFVIKSWQVGL